MAVKKKYTTKTKFTALGRGLDALISTEAVKTEGSSTISEIPIEQIEANPNQPRRDFDETALQELANSISEIGIIQPITLHQVSEQRYMIIAGERRWRASQLAGLKSIPAYIRTLDDASIMEMALVENIQREDLNAIEVALAYQKLMEGEGMTQEKVSQRVGKSRTAVTNTLRLLRLPAQVQMALQKKQIDMGHARALLSLESPSQQVKLFKEIAKNGYSVRKVEEMVQKIKASGDEPADNQKPKSAVALVKQYEPYRRNLEKTLSAKVRIKITTGGKGKIDIPFDNEEQLNKLIGLLGKIGEQ
jgi:ParB family transcriptional regulator, chromosome partitioning protein